MESTLKAPLAELAHIDVADLRRTLKMRRSPWARFAPAGIGLAAAALAVALYRWRRS